MYPSFGMGRSAMTGMPGGMGGSMSPGRFSGPSPLNRAAPTFSAGLDGQTPGMHPGVLGHGAPQMQMRGPIRHDKPMDYMARAYAPEGGVRPGTYSGPNVSQVPQVPSLDQIQAEMARRQVGQQLGPANAALSGYMMGQ